MHVGVIGSGSIGPDLAYGFLSSLATEPSAKVFLVDIKQEALDAGVARIHAYIEKGKSRGKLSAKLAASMKEQLVPTLQLADLATCTYVLEAASEELSIKHAILKELEGVVSASCLIGFATSGLPRAQIAASAKHPERCFVNHPFYPAWRSLPIEVVHSGDPNFEGRMIATLERLGKVPVVTSDVPCFAADDIFCNYIAEAARIVSEGIANAAQVDRIVHSAIGGGGPFNVMDATRGNLLVVKCQKLMQEAETGGAWFAPPAILSERGDALWHDRKAPQDAASDPAVAEIVLDRILAVLISRTYFVLEQGICEATELEWMTRMALGFSPGIFEFTEKLGAARALSICERYAAKNPGFYLPTSLALDPRGEQHLPQVRKATKVLRDGEVGTILVYRPEVKNALSKRTIEEIDSAFDELSADDTITGIILTSTDGAFAGADIGELAALQTPEACRAICNNTHPVMLKMSRSRKPLVAALDGPVLGGGAEFAMACQARVVGKNLVLGQPEVNLGIIPGYGGTQRLPRLIGLERANQLLRNGATIKAAEACKLGWAVDVPADNPKTAARQLILDQVQGKVRLSPLASEPLSLPTKLPHVDIGHRSLAIDAILVSVMERGLGKSLEEGLAIEAEGFAACKATVDMDIGMKNFMQNGPRVPACFLHE